MSDPNVYPRDASWWNHPSTSGPKKYHRKRIGTSWTAACSVRIQIDRSDATLPEQVATLLCRRCFPESQGSES